MPTKPVPAQAGSGHPRSFVAVGENNTWMAGASPAMTNNRNLDARFRGHDDENKKLIILGASPRMMKNRTWMPGPPRKAGSSFKNRAGCDPEARP
jgi:hypothetical protein